MTDRLEHLNTLTALEGVAIISMFLLLFAIGMIREDADD